MLGSLTIHRLFEKMREVNASDLHIKPGSPPVLRIASKLHRVESGELNPDDTRQLLVPIIPPHLKETFDGAGGVDFSHMEGPEARFRCSIFHAGGSVHAAIRRVNPEIPSFEALHLPAVYGKVADETHEGLVVVCGVTGCGKSTTLAAMIDHINETRHCNIITIEDPVEFLFQPKQSFISQREIGIDVMNFPLALRAAGTFLAASPNWSADDYIEALSDQGKRLGRLDGVEVVLGLSAAQLVRENRELAERWQMLTVFPATFDLPAAAAVLDGDEAQARDTLTPLEQRSLILFEADTQRYRFHDLMRRINLEPWSPPVP